MSNSRPIKIIIFLQLCATLGTTGACAFDNLEELGPICKDLFQSIFIYLFIGIIIPATLLMVFVEVHNDF